MKCPKCGIGEVVVSWRGTAYGAYGDDSFDIETEEWAIVDETPPICPYCGEQFDAPPWGNEPLSRNRPRKPKR